MDYAYAMNMRDYARIEKLNNLTDPKTFWNDVRKLTKSVYSDASIKRWQRLAEVRYEEIKDGVKITTNSETKFNVGDTMYYVYKEFDGKGKIKGTITEICDDHFILTEDGINYWFEAEDLGTRVFATDEEAEYVLNNKMPFEMY